MVMDKFESQFEDLEVQTGYMENSMNASTSLTTPQNQVDMLMQQVADEHGLELKHGLNTKIQNVELNTTQGDINERLAKLRNI